MINSQKKILSMRSISKEFLGTKALRDVNFDLMDGEVHAIVGANGAGKSTLINILGGHYSDYSGTIIVDGNKTIIHSPRKSQQLGITVLAQEINLVKDMSVAENIYLGNEPFLKKGLGIIDRTSMIDQSALNLKKFDIELDPKIKAAELSALESQIVLIVKALVRNARIIVMDEPTALLTANETKLLYKTIESLSSNKISVIFISHRFEDIFEVSDRVTVLRDGRKVFEGYTESTSNDEIVFHMLGKESLTFKKPFHTTASKLLSVKNLNSKTLKNISFDLFENETLGIIGKSGSGGHELMRALYGDVSITSGEVYLENTKINVTNPRKSVDYGIGFLSEDRRRDGLFPFRDVTDNITMPYLMAMSRMGIVNEKRRRTMTYDKVDELDIKTSSIQQPVAYLSGGNQQKVIFARLLCNKNAKVFIIEEPTRGIDISTKAEIYSIVHGFNDRGNGCIVMSSDIDELILLTNRIILLDQGAIIKVLNTEDVSKSDLLGFVMGTTANA